MFIGIKRKFFISEMKVTSDEESRKAQVQYLKQVNFHRGILKKTRTGNLVPSQFTFKFSLIHVKTDVIVLASVNSTSQNKSELFGLCQKQKYCLKTSFVSKIESKKCFSTWEIN